jgi:hypothetical protein
VAHIACFVHLFLHDLESLATTAEQAAACDESPIVAAVGRFCRGRLLIARGEHGRGITVMREALDDYGANGQRLALPEMLAVVAEAHAAAGETAAALACVADARVAAQQSGEIRYAAELRRVEGTLHAAGDDRSAAERCFRDAVSIAREQGELLWELRAVTTWAQMAQRAGTRGAMRRDLRADLERLVTSFDVGTDIADLRDAQRAVAALRGDRSR